MEATAQARYVRVTPQKARRVVDLIRGKQASEAVAVLMFAPQSASDPVRKVLQSAMANARVKADAASEAFDERELVITAAFVDEGPTLKRFRPRAQGRASRINKRTSHITVTVLSPEPVARQGRKAAATSSDAPAPAKKAAKKSAAAKTDEAPAKTATTKVAAKSTTKKAAKKATKSSESETSKGSAQ